MKRFWIQAHDSLKNENWDAANVMARSALQFVVRDKSAATPQDARDIVNFLDLLLLYLYDLPKQIADFRQRKNPGAEPT